MVLLYSHCATFFRNVALTQKETWLCSLSWDYELKSMLRRVWFISGENLCLFVALIQFNAVTTTRTSQPKDSHPLENLKFYFGSEQACWSRFQTWIFRSRSRHCQPEHSRDPRVHLTTYRRILKLNSWRCKLDTFIAHMRTIRYDTIRQSLSDYQMLLLAVPFARHTHRGVLRRRHAATHQPGARREVSHLRPDPATAAEGRGHCCISMATNLCLCCRPMSPLGWKMDVVVTGFHPGVLIYRLKDYLQQHICYSILNTLFLEVK